MSRASAASPWHGHLAHESQDRDGPGETRAHGRDGRGTHWRDAHATRVPAVGVLRGVFWHQWLAHGRAIVRLALGYLLLGWVLMIFDHPAWVMVYGIVAALYLGPAIGGADVSQGTEEFTFGLPPLRRHHWLVRMTLGLVTVLAITVFGIAAIRWNLPQGVWGLVVESGFTEPFKPERSRYFYTLAVVVPLTVYVISFSISAVAWSRNVLAVGWLIALVIVGLLAWAGNLVERVFSLAATAATTPLLGVTAAAALGLGYLGYIHKEAGGSAATGRRSLWLIVLVAVVVLLVLLATFWTAPSRVGD